MRTLWTTVRKWWLLASCLVLAGASVLTWLNHDRVLGWWYVERLARAQGAERDTWVRRTANLGTAAVPALVTTFARTDVTACENVRMCCCQMLKQWGVDSPQSASLFEALGASFSRFGGTGQSCALDVGRYYALQYPEGAADILPLLLEASHSSESDIRARSLTLAEMMLGKTKGQESVNGCRDVIRIALRDEVIDIRARAMKLATRLEIELLAELVPLLRDPSAEIRRAAVVAVGPVPEAIATDDLLSCLHDADAEVRRLCEGVLRGRGLQDHHLKMGRLISDPQPSMRISVLEYLRRNTDVEPGVWLRRLSHDADASVRAATLRFAREEALVDLSDRVQQMQHADPSLTIRQLATYYLSLQKN